MSELTCLQPNHGEIAAEIIDNEVIMIRLTDGIYYSMEGVGVLVWRLLEAGGSIDDIVKEVIEVYEADVDQVSNDLTELFESLQRERLIVTGDRAQAMNSQTALKTDGDFTPSQYQKPSLHVYEDMNDLLALDPPSPGQQHFDSSDIPD